MANPRDRALSLGRASCQRHTGDLEACTMFDTAISSFIQMPSHSCNSTLRWRELVQVVAHRLLYFKNRYWCSGYDVRFDAAVVRDIIQLSGHHLRHVRGIQGRQILPEPMIEVAQSPALWRRLMKCRQIASAAAKPSTGRHCRV